MSVALALLASVVGACAGALVLYALAAALGLEGSVRWLSKLPLVDREDFERATDWFQRHGKAAVFFGRLIPGVRSLISLPAGASRMHLLTFSVFTLLGSAIWNGLLIGLGVALGTQYEVVDRYSNVLNLIVYVALAGVLLALVLRRVRRGRRTR